MPSISLGTAFLAGLLEKDGRLLRNPDLQSMYGLEDGSFDGGLQKLKPTEADAVKALVVAAKADITILLESEAGRSRLRNNLHQDGKKAIGTWLSKTGITSKIHASIEEVLTLSNCHPRQILEDVDEDKSPTMLPDETTIHSEIELGVANAVFGPNAVAIRISSHQVKIIKAIMHHVWNRLRKERTRMYKLMQERKQAWMTAKNGKPSRYEIRRPISTLAHKLSTSVAKI
jgi:hypothetical protein